MALKIPGKVAFHVFSFNVFTFVVEFLSLAKGDFNFGLCVAKICLCWDKSQTAFRHSALEAIQFVAVKEEFTFSSWIVVGSIPVRILWDVHVKDVAFVAFKLSE